MITLEKACELALKNTFFEKPGIYGIRETKELWIISFYNKNDPNEIYYGNIPTSINKKTGISKPYPIQSNLDEYFRKAKKIKFPKAYR